MGQYPMGCYPTPEALRKILGPHWAICRNTERNRQRYGRCITPKEYQRACDEALKLANA